MATSKKSIRLDFNVLVYREDSWWIAHCLEMDLPAEGKTPIEAVHNLLDLARLQISTAMDEGDLASIFMPAPSELWRSYAIASDMRLARPPRLSHPLNRLEVRTLAGVL